MICKTPTLKKSRNEKQKVKRIKKKYINKNNNDSI